MELADLLPEQSREHIINELNRYMKAVEVDKNVLLPKAEGNHRPQKMQRFE